MAMTAAKRSAPQRSTDELSTGPIAKPAAEFSDGLFKHLLQAQLRSCEMLLEIDGILLSPLPDRAKLDEIQRRCGDLAQQIANTPFPDRETIAANSGSPSRAA